jgi:cysteine-rich repeat protein
MRKFHLYPTLSALVFASLASACGGGGATGSGGSGAAGGSSGGSGGSGGAAPVCGDGHVDQGEECDDGDKNGDTAACTKACKKAVCGDGLKGPSEECDDGVKNSDTAACTATCKQAKCGDGLVQTGVEECDDGDKNGDTAACTATCKKATCGDGLVQTGKEECDHGAANSDSSDCTTECKNAVCGDGKIENGKEECDDGMANADTGACTSKCKQAKCGDSLVQAGKEGCDDGNMVDNDACTNMCTLPACGDGILQAGEDCDLGMKNDNNGACTVLCKAPKCGDGFTETGVEECDNGAMNGDTTACTSMCKNAKCGDGLVQAGKEECDLGAQNNNTGNCTVSCKNPKCGDGFVHAGVEACDDGNLINGDGCNNDCVVSGTVLGTQTYTGAAGTGALWTGAATDSAGNVFVTGGEATAGQGVDIVLRKYSPAGAVMWTQTANGSANGADYGEGVAVDASGNVFVIGIVNDTGTGEDIFIRKYNGSTGATIWTQIYNGALGGNDEGFGVAVGPTGDIFVTGAVNNAAGQDFNLWYAKLAGINGTVVYQSAVNGAANQVDAGVGIAADAMGNFVITGLLRASANNADVWTTYFKDNVNSATQVWTRTYNGLANGDDVGNGVALDPSGNVIAVGSETVSGQGSNVWVRKYDSAGNTVWTQGYNGVANLDDGALGVGVDASGNIVLAGSETLANMKSDVWVRKLSPAGATLWTKGYNGSLDDNDQAFSAAIDPSGNAWLAGYETIVGPKTQAWLRKYAP